MELWNYGLDLLRFNGFHLYVGERRGAFSPHILGYDRKGDVLLFTIQITADGFTETLIFNGQTYVKRYKKDKHGWEGLDRTWEDENLPSQLIYALEERDPLEIMDVLSNKDD